MIERHYLMEAFFKKIKTLALGSDAQRGTAFYSVRATQKGLGDLTGSAEYDVHHALVEGLERFNGDIRGDMLNRIEVLRVLEKAGLPLQDRLLAQYLKSHAENVASRQTLWRECHLFWDQLAVAYLPFLREVMNRRRESEAHAVEHRVTLGLTLTTPSLDIGGKGTTGMYSTLAGLDTDGDGVPDDSLAADYRDGLDSYFQTPFSIAAGMTFKIQKIRFYWSTEWFAAIKPYKVVDAEEFTAQTTGETLSTDDSHELAPVLNFGMGLEWFYSSRFKGYGSFTTDYSAKVEETSTNLAMTDWDIYLIVTGGEIKLRKSWLTIGFGYSFGSREVGQRPGVLPPGGLDGLWDPFRELEFRYAIYKLIVGFAF